MLTRALDLSPFAAAGDERKIEVHPPLFREDVFASSDYGFIHFLFGGVSISYVQLEMRLDQ